MEPSLGQESSKKMADTQRHYSACPFLWDIVEESISSLPSEPADGYIEIAKGVVVRRTDTHTLTDFSAAIACNRMCMTSPSQRSLCKLALAFKLYHWLKREHYEEVKAHCTAGSFEITRALTRDYAQLLVAELSPD